MFIISSGDIISAVVNEYIDYPGGNWCDHFVKRKHYFKVISASNNGSILVKGIGGKIQWFYAAGAKDIKKVK